MPTEPYIIQDEYGYVMIIPTGMWVKACPHASSYKKFDWHGFHWMLRTNPADATVTPLAVCDDCIYAIGPDAAVKPLRLKKDIEVRVQAPPPGIREARRDPSTFSGFGCSCDNGLGLSTDPYERAMERIEALRARGKDPIEGTLRRLAATTDPDKVVGIFMAARKLAERKPDWKFVMRAASQRFTYLTGGKIGAF